MTHCHCPLHDPRHSEMSCGCDNERKWNGAEGECKPWSSTWEHAALPTCCIPGTPEWWSANLWGYVWLDKDLNVVAHEKHVGRHSH